MRASAEVANCHQRSYMRGMNEPSPEDTQALIAYARRKYAEERWPLSVDLKPIREVLRKVSSRHAPTPSLTVVADLGHAVNRVQAKRQRKTS